jgi:phosphatase NudJ
MSRAPIPTWYYALVVVRLGHRFLVVQEPRDGTWYLPAGRVEAGESMIDGARRETLEEAGIPIVIEGIMRVQHTPRHDGTARLRVIFVARPADDTPPKSTPDKESLGARWVSLDELKTLQLRDHEVREIFQYVASGGAIHPLSILTSES